MIYEMMNRIHKHYNINLALDTASHDIAFSSHPGNLLSFHVAGAHSTKKQNDRETENAFSTTTQRPSEI